MDKNKCSSCGETKCSCKNKDFTKAVIEIDNPEQITLMRKVVIPASMGDDTTVPPEIGKYKNVLLYYEANSKSYLYSSDGIPTLLANGVTDYEQAVNLPQINGVTLIGNKTLNEIGIKAYVFDTVADMKASVDLISGDYAKTLGYSTINDGGGALYFITDLVMNDTYQEQLDSGLLASIVGKEVKTSQLGLEPNDGTKAQANFDKLASVMDMGYSIVVDNTYYLSASEMHTIAASTFNMRGEESKGVLKFNPSAVMPVFRLNNCSEINVTNMTLINEGNYTVRFMRLRSDSAWHVNNCNFTNNTVEGSIAVLESSYSADISPVLGVNGFDFLKISGNKFHNLTKVSCFNLFDSIARKIEIKDNYVHNFTNKFFGLTITNGTQYAGVVARNILLTEVDNNYVFCDNDYAEDSSDNAAYYVFILLEGHECIYTNNHVEGLKSFKEVALYDAYLSVQTLYSFNNVYKNNMLFGTGDDYCLFKSKGGDADGTGIKRYYDHNTYIIEEDWQKLFDPDLSKYVLFVDILSNTKGVAYQITNCYIDVTNLYGRNPDFPMEYGNLLVKDNYIRMKKSTVRPLFCAKTQEDDTTICIKDNIIIDESYKSYLFGAYSGVIGDTTYVNVDKVFIENNKFSGSDIVFNCDINTLKIYNNDFEFSRSDGPTRLIYDSDPHAIDLTFKDNDIKTIEPNIDAYLLRMPMGSNVVDIDNIIYAKLPYNQYQGFVLSGNLDTDSVYRYFFEFDIQHTTGVQKINFYVDYGKDGTGNYVKFIDTTDTEVTLYTTDSTTSIKVNNETSITTSTARMYIGSGNFSVQLSIGYAVADQRYFVRAKMRSVKLS